MVDALSALHFDLIELALRQSLSDRFDIAINPVFAPLPTITEVAKTSVLTGQLPGNRSSDMEKAVYERFAEHLKPDALQIVKGWKTFRVPLEPSTRLLIYFDNQIDDDLHQCTDYHRHRERVRTTVLQLAKIVGGWQYDAASHHLEAAVILTADHGATKVSATLPALPETAPIENRLLTTAREPGNPHENFAFVSSVNGGYLIPYGRVAFGSAHTMLHGGLTPEEVLIPFVLMTRIGATIKTPLSLEPLSKRCQPVESNSWSVNLKISNLTRDTFYQLKVVAKSPFSGSSIIIESLGPLEEKGPIALIIVAAHAQSVLTQVPFELRYQGKDELRLERLQFIFDLTLTEHLVKQTDEAQQFNDIWDI